MDHPTETVADSSKPLVPPILYVPVADYLSDSDELTIEFRQLHDGRTALVAFTALDRLIAGCGSAQPWVVLSTEKLAEIDRHTPYDVILLDVQIPEDQQRQPGDH